MSNSRYRIIYFEFEWFMWVVHDSYISNGRVIHPFESLITIKQPSTNKIGRQIHLFSISVKYVFDILHKSHFSLGNLINLFSVLVRDSSTFQVVVILLLL